MISGGSKFYFSTICINYREDRTDSWKEVSHLSVIHKYLLGTSITYLDTHILCMLRLLIQGMKKISFPWQDFCPYCNDECLVVKYNDKTKQNTLRLGEGSRGVHERLTLCDPVRWEELLVNCFQICMVFW